MKKLSEVFESAWGDMMRRSSGEIIRKEDDINLYTPKKMYEYINDHYERIDNRWSSVYIEESEIIFVPICILNENQVLTNISYDYKKNVILIFETLLSYIKFNENFIISNYDEGRVSISPKKGEVNNRFFIETLDYILDNFDHDTTPVIAKKKMNESAWGDMMRRSSGDIIRKEDDISHFNMRELYDYIFELYDWKTKSPTLLPLMSQSNFEHEYFSIPIFKSNLKGYRIDVTFTNDKIKKVALLASVNDIKDFKDVLIDNFKVTVRPDDALDIRTKEGEVTNQLCMDVIKTIVENAPDPILKKKYE